MRPLRTLGATVALLCALVGSVIAGRWPSPERALVTPQRQLSAGALEGVVRWMGAGVPQPTAVENSTDPDVWVVAYYLKGHGREPRRLITDKLRSYSVARLIPK